MKKLIDLGRWRKCRTSLAVLMLATGFAGAANAQAKKKSPLLYRGSFSKPEIFVNESIPESMKGKKDTVGVPSMNSFPLRIQVSESDVNGWSQPSTLVNPKKISKGFKVGACEFAIVSGDFAVRQYSGENADDLLVVADAVIPQSMFSVDAEEDILFSLSTMLTVNVDPKFQNACKAAFSEKKYVIGHASLARSSFFGVGKKGGTVAATVFRPESTTKLYVTWSPDAKGLALQDQMGLVPDIETSVFAFKFAEKDSYYLGFDPAFKILKEKSIVAH